VNLVAAGRLQRGLLCPANISYAAQDGAMSFFGTAERRKLMQKIHTLTHN